MTSPRPTLHQFVEANREEIDRRIRTLCDPSITRTLFIDDAWRRTWIVNEPTLTQWAKDEHRVVGI